MATEVITQVEAGAGVEEKRDSLPPQANQARRKRNVATTLNYYRDPGDGTPPMDVYVGKKTVDNKRPSIPVSTTIYDITGEEKKYKLDTHGFQLESHKSHEQTFDDDTRIKNSYYAECEELYKKITGATKVHIFQHQVRRGPSHWHSLGAGNASNKGPLHRAHIDQSYSGAELILRKHLPLQCSSILSRNQRYQIINLWRPISTIFKDPLAVASAHSIPDSDLIQARIIYVDQPGPLNRNETWTIVPGEGHEWYFKNEQRTDEVLFIKCFDSEEREGLARRVPHCAFKDPEREGEEWADRQSIEIRALLVYDD